MTPETPIDAPAFLPGFTDARTGFTLDLSGMPLNGQLLAGLERAGDNGAASAIERADTGMRSIEAGAIKNPDEQRQVTHFTDRLTYCDTALFTDVQDFAEQLRSGTLQPAGSPIDYVIVNGIGGSALGPQLLQFAINGPYWNELSRQARQAWPRVYFLDNTDPTGLTDVLAVADLRRSVVVTVSKSGGTRETRNNMVSLQAAFTAAGLSFAAHAVAVTMAGSTLHDHALKQGWLKVFPMSDSIGGRTSETNIVGHVPAALTGIDFATFVQGAKTMDALTRAPALADNPAYQLAVAWYVAGAGRGDRNMVVVPYSDRLVLLGRYLQQLVMESLGKELDLAGKVVNQGLTVYGNKGGTDAHAYIQQLNDGRNDFFITFIEILKDSAQLDVGDGFTMGDYLHGFKAGLVNALRGKHRPVIEITIPQLNPATLGMIIALYERAVAFYAELIGVNAFHQPGVQAYKLASNDVNALNAQLRTWLAAAKPGWTGTAAAAAAAAGCDEPERNVENILAKFAANGRRFGRITVSRQMGDGGWQFTLNG